MRIVVKDLSGDGRVTLTGYIQEPSEEMRDVTNKPAVLICPGGAYLFVSDREAEPIALAYAAEGFQTFVLRYSVGNEARGFKPLAEASAAIKMIRDNSEEWHVIPDQIVACGFSAGGHLAAAVGLLGDHRPNALILGYPAIDLGEAARDYAKHNPLVLSLIGEDIKQEELDAYSLHKQVTAEAPPMFVWHTFDDEVVAIEHSLKLVNAYADLGVPFEYHVFQKGVHGLSLAKSITATGKESLVNERVQAWFGLSVDWMRELFA